MFKKCERRNGDLPYKKMPGVRMKAKAMDAACADAHEKLKSQVKTSYACTGVMATKEASEEDMDFLEQIIKKAGGMASKPRAAAKTKSAASPPARTIAIAKGATPPPNKSQVRVLAKPKIMEIHFYESEFSVPSGEECHHGWVETEQAIQEQEPYIVTTQMGFLSTNLFEKGYRIFVHPMEDRRYEIRLGRNACTDRQIVMKNNLFRLWSSGEFSA